MEKLEFKKYLIDKCVYNKKRADVGWYEKLCIERQYGLRIVKKHGYDTKLFCDPLDYNEIAKTVLKGIYNFTFKPTGHIKLTPETALCRTFEITPQKVKGMFSKIDKMLSK